MNTCKLVGFMKNSFTDKSTGRVVEYAKIWAGDEIVRNGSGLNVSSFKSTVQVVDGLTPDLIGADVCLFFDKYNRVQLVEIPMSDRGQ